MPRRLLLLAGLALALPAAASAQVVPSGSQRTQGTGDANRGDPVNVRVVACNASGTCTDGVNGAAASTPQEGTVTSTGVTPSSGTATFAGSTATIGPLAPQLNRPIRVVLRGTWSGSLAIGTSTNACTTFNPLTVAGQTWASFTANANEAVDMPSIAGVVYCAQATVSSGTLNYVVRQ